MNILLKFGGVMKKFTLLFIGSIFFLSGCFFTGQKSPDVIEVETSGSYKDQYDEKRNAVIITGAYNNLEFDSLRNFKEIISWTNEEGEVYIMDFSDETNPLYIKGRNNITYIAVRVAPGKYSLKDFSINLIDEEYQGNIKFSNRYQASFEIGENEVIFVGILRTTFDKFKLFEFNVPGRTSITVSTFLENGKEDLYRITNFYDRVTQKPVKSNIMFWNDTLPGNTEFLNIN